MPKPRIYADFNSGGQDGDEYFVCLGGLGTFRDLERLGLELHDGLEAIIYTDDADDEGNSDELEGDGVVKFWNDLYGWVAVIDESTFRHVSDRLREGKGRPTTGDEEEKEK